MKLWLKILLVVTCVITIINGASNAVDKIKENVNNDSTTSSDTAQVMVVQDIAAQAAYLKGSYMLWAF